MDITTRYIADEQRYDQMKFRRCGKSGVLLPEVSLGFWHNFGGADVYEHCRQTARYAFDHGITHFDLAMVLPTVLPRKRWAD